MTKIGLFTGSFDPVTKGHVDIIERASKLFDKLYVGIFYNYKKQGYFDVAVRERMMIEAVAHLDNVSVVVAQDALAVDLARELGVSYFVRGLRNSQDFGYEANLEFFNKYLAEEIETIYLGTRSDLVHISSNRVRELIHFGAPIKDFVPQSVLKEVEEERVERKEKK